MRPKIVFGIVFLALGFLGLVVLVRPASDAGEPDVEIASVPTTPSTGEVVGPMDSALPPLGCFASESQVYFGKNLGLEPSRQVNPAFPNSLRPEALREIPSRFLELSMKSDADSLNSLLMGMQNLDKGVRRAALEAVVQFDDRSAIPKLQEIASQTEDTGEKKAIEEAIEYINLPSLMEYFEQRKTELANLKGVNEIRISRNSRSKKAKNNPSLGTPPSPLGLDP